MTERSNISPADVLVVIPARGGSKGIPGKNIKPLGGHPLLHYSIWLARRVVPDAQILLSTDSPGIQSVAEETGLHVPFLRPPELATDAAGTYGVLLHSLDWAEAQHGRSFPLLLLLQPTSPFRQLQDLRRCFEAYRPGTELVVSVMESKANPYYTLFEEDAQGYLQQSKPGHYTRRQDCPPVYEYNGALYLIDTAALRQRPLHQFTRKRKVLMPEERSLDLDTPLDWQIAELLLQNALVSLPEQTPPYGQT